MKNFYILILVINIVTLFFNGCDKSTFQQNPNHTKDISKTDINSSDNSLDNSATQDNSSSSNDISQRDLQEKDFIVGPKLCDSNNMKVYKSLQYENIEKRCPQYYAIYALDDNISSEQYSVYFACCPLPYADIIKYDEIHIRSYTCLQDEIMIGAQGGKTQIICAKINTQKYFLALSEKSCYEGSGVSGQGQAGSCNQPHETWVALQKYFGTDACFGSTYGALFVADQGRKCDQKYSSILYDKQTNKPVVMFK